jgi:putative transcriptional regulator
MTSPSDKFGPRLRQARVAAGLTQAELAERADVADATVSRIERGRLVPSVALAKRIAAALRVPLDELMSPNARPPKATLRQSEARYLAIVRDLDDAVIDDISKGLRLIIAAARRGGRKV